MHQPELDFAPMGKIDKAFLLFDENHPDVYRLFVKYARLLKARRWRHYSSDAILHKIRVDHDVNPERETGFKLNDHFTSRYARKLMAEHPAEFAGFFEVRKLKAERKE